MILRPTAANWFELLTPRDQLTGALRCLAETGAVELQSHSQEHLPARLPSLRHGLEEFGVIARRYAAWWPEPEAQPLEPEEEPSLQLEEALESLRSWEASAAPVIAELQHRQRELEDLALLREALEGEDRSVPDLGRFPGSGPYLAAALFELPDEAELREAPPSVLLKTVRGTSHRFLFAVGAMREIEALETALSTLKARRIEVPPWLPPDVAKARAELDRRQQTLAGRIDRLRHRLDMLEGSHGLAAALWRLRLLDWYVTHVPELPVTERFAWVTGWTSDTDSDAMEARLRAAGVHHLLRFSAAPSGLEPPVVLSNPPWARPFELFASLLGTPGEQDVDPSMIVALMAPILFGFMFGDVGHGAVLLLAGLALRRRLPVLRLLVPGGLSAILFGFLYGSIFGIEHWIPALWLNPLEQPLALLGASLAFGVAVVTLGLILDAQQCHWHGDDLEFWGGRIGLAVTYGGLLYAIVFVDALGVWAAVVGSAWFVAGTALRARPEHVAAAGNAAAEYVETVLQLLVNTVSFVRVGAFALAHSGLCAAVIAIADAVESLAGKAVVLLLGNVLIIGLEGLVVSIQTTRLVLFEFFIRFLHSSARSFRATPGPGGQGAMPTGRET